MNRRTLRSYFLTAELVRVVSGQGKDSFDVLRPQCESGAVIVRILDQISPGFAYPLEHIDSVT